MFCNNNNCVSVITLCYYLVEFNLHQVCWASCNEFGHIICVSDHKSLLQHLHLQQILISHVAEVWSKEWSLNCWEAAGQLFFQVLIAGENHWQSYFYSLLPHQYLTSHIISKVWDGHSLLSRIFCHKPILILPRSRESHLRTSLTSSLEVRKSKFLISMEILSSEAETTAFSAKMPQIASWNPPYLWSYHPDPAESPVSGL